MTFLHTPRVPLVVTIVALVLAILGGAIGVIGLIDPALLDFGNPATGRTWAGRTLGLAVVMLLAVVLRSRATYIAAFAGGLCRDVSDLFAGIIGNFRPDLYLAVPFILVGMISLILLLNAPELPKNPIPVAAAAAGAGAAAAAPNIGAGVSNAFGGAAPESGSILPTATAEQPAAFRETLLGSSDEGTKNDGAELVTSTEQDDAEADSPAVDTSTDADTDVAVDGPSPADAAAEQTTDQVENADQEPAVDQEQDADASADVTANESATSEDTATSDDSAESDDAAESGEADTAAADTAVTETSGAETGTEGTSEDTDGSSRQNPTNG